MSPSRDRSARRDDGFTLVEIIVSLGLFAIVSTAVVAQVIVGMRAAATARDISQAKGVAQARLEQMRMMPFFVGRSAGDYIDVLDTYYRHTTAPVTTAPCTSGSALAEPQTSWTGYLPAAAARCSYEPPGPMFRRVINPVQAPGMGAFALVVNTQFITQGSPPSAVTPQAGYNSQVAGSDVPAANQIGVTVTVVYKSQSGFKHISLYSQIGQRTPVAPMIENAVTVSTVRMGSAMDAATPTNLRLDVGLINLIGELSTGSKVTANATAGSAGTSLGAAATGASVNATAPADTPAQSATGTPVGLFGGCSHACLGSSEASGVSAYSSDGLPLSGSPFAPVQATLPGSTTHNGFQFSNGKAGTRLRLSNSSPMVSLKTDEPAPTRLVTDCSFSSSGTPAYLGATAFMDATKETGADHVRSCGTAHTGTIMVLPTDFAPNGIVQVDLERAAVDCKVVGTASGGRTPTASVDYRARVRYWNGSSYTQVPLVEKANGTDPLAAVDLTQVIGPGGLRLSDFISSWRSLAPSDITVTASGNRAEASVPAIVSIDTQPTREGVPGGTGPHSADPTSGVSVQIAALSCKAMDAR